MTSKRAAALCWRCCGSRRRLSAIAFTVANTVRGETERTSTAVDSLRCYYLAAGSIDRALLHIQWGDKYYKAPMPVMRFTYPSGEAIVEIIPETAKLSINRATPEDLLGRRPGASAPRPEQAAGIVRGIVDWRTAAPGDSFTEFDQLLSVAETVFPGPARVL